MMSHEEFIKSQGYLEQVVIAGRIMENIESLEFRTSNYMPYDRPQDPRTCWYCICQPQPDRPGFSGKGFIILHGYFFCTWECLLEGPQFCD